MSRSFAILASALAGASFQMVSVAPAQAEQTGVSCLEAWKKLNLPSEAATFFYQGYYCSDSQGTQMAIRHLLDTRPKVRDSRLLPSQKDWKKGEPLAKCYYDSFPTPEQLRAVKKDMGIKEFPFAITPALYGSLMWTVAVECQPKPLM